MRRVFPFQAGRKGSETEKSAVPGVPPGIRVYAIGDLHGRADLLHQMIKSIRADVSSLPPAEVLLVFIGDYIDRGPNSRDVIQVLSGGLQRNMIALRGNHDDLMLRFLRHPQSVAEEWLRLGGATTLQSYGVHVYERGQTISPESVSKSLSAVLPRSHLDFLVSLRTHVSIGDYFFCHAGVRPGIPLHEQRTEDLLCIRGEFLNARQSFGKIVVHGHTPVAEPEILINRINIDTGAYITGHLSCLVLEGTTRRFLQT